MEGVFHDRGIASFREEIHGIIRSQLGGGIIRAYYPGIGGGEEPLDLVSATVSTDADLVYGIDLFPAAHNGQLNTIVPKHADIFEVWAATVRLYQKLGVCLEPSNISETDLEWSLDFVLGRPRRVIISKIPTDSQYLIPQEVYPLIYSRRTIDLVQRLPRALIDNARVVLFKGELMSDAESLIEFGQKNGFKIIDIQRIAKSLGCKVIPYDLALMIR